MKVLPLIILSMTMSLCAQDEKPPQQITIPIPGSLQKILSAKQFVIELDQNISMNSTYVSGKIIQPEKYNPLVAVPNIPEALTAATISEPKISIAVALKDVLQKKIPFEYVELYGLITLDQLNIELGLKIKKNNGKFGVAVIVRTPPVHYPVQPLQLSLNNLINTFSKFVPLLSDINDTIKPILNQLGTISISQFSVVLTQFEYDEVITHQGEGTTPKEMNTLVMRPYINLYIESSDTINAGTLIPALKESPLSLLEISNISLLIQNIKDKETLKKELPSVTLYANSTISSQILLPESLATTIDINHAITFNEYGFEMTSTVIDPEVLKPFQATNVPMITDVTMSNLQFKTSVELAHDDTRKISRASTILHGESEVPALKISARSEMHFLTDINTKKMHGILKLFPKKIAFLQLVPEASNTILADMNFDATEIIINSTDYMDPDLEEQLQKTLNNEKQATELAQLKPGVSLYSNFKQTTLGKLLPHIKNTPLAAVAMNDVMIFVKDINPQQIPSLIGTGKFDLTPLKLPYLTKNLGTLDGTISYNQQDGLKLDVAWQETIKISFDNKQIGSVSNPHAIVSVAQDDKGKIQYSVQIIADGTITLPELGKLDITTEFDITDKQLSQKFLVKNDITYRSIQLKQPIITLKEGQETGFVLEGTSQFDNLKVHSQFSIMKSGKNTDHEGFNNPQTGYNIRYNGQFLSNVQPFKQLSMYSGISGVPEEIKNITVYQPQVGLYISQKEQRAFIFGTVRLYGFDTEASFHAVRNYLGKTGYTIFGILKGKGEKEVIPSDALTDGVIYFKDIPMSEIAMGELMKAVLPHNVMLAYENTVPAPLKNIFNALPAPILGIALTNIQFNIYLGKDSLSVFPIKNSIDFELNAGASIFGIMDTVTLVKSFGNIGTVDVLGKKVNLFNPNLLTNDVTAQSVFIASAGLSPKDFQLTMMAGDNVFKYDFGKNYNIAPGPYFLEFSLEPSMALAVETTLNTPLSKNIKFIGKAEPIFEGIQEGSLKPSVNLDLSLTMDGEWNQPFGIQELALSNVALDIAGDITQQAVAEGTEVTVASAAGPEGTAAGAATGALPINIVSGGFTYAGRLGAENDPQKITGDVAMHMDEESMYEFLIIGRQWGIVGTPDLVRMMQSIGQLSDFLYKNYLFMSYLVNPKNISNVQPPTKLPQLIDKSKQYGPAPQKLATQTIAQSMQTTQQVISQQAVLFKKEMDTLTQFAHTVTDTYTNSIAEFFKWLNVSAENLEARYAADDIQIGELWFDRGFQLRGILHLHGYSFGFNATIDYSGITLEGFMPIIDFAKLSGLDQSYPQLANQIVVTGVGPDGKSGNQDDGPAVNIELNLKQQPQMTITGHIILKPLGTEGDGEISATVKDGYSMKFSGKLFSQVDAEFDLKVAMEQGKPNLVGTIILNNDFVQNFKNVTLTALKTTKFTQDKASQAAQDALTQAQQALKPLTDQEATLEQQIAQKKASLAQKQQAWKTGINKSIQTIQSNITQVQQDIKNLTQQIASLWQQL